MKGSSKTLKSKADFLEAYRAKQGSISEACNAIGIARLTYYRWTEHDEDFRRLIDEADQAEKDFGETQLKKLMSGIPKMKAGKQIGWLVRPDTAAVIFYNKTQNKDRGYIERTENEAIGGVHIVVQNEEDADLVRQVSKIWEN